MKNARRQNWPNTENSTPTTREQPVPRPGRPAPRPSLAVETLEPRILLSATWVDADTGDPLDGPTRGADVFDGSIGVDVADGLGGDDILQGGAGDDVLFGGKGNDTLGGGIGNDELHGGAGVDALSGEAGNDQLFGDDGNDSLIGLAGDDQLDGGKGNDSLTGGEGNDALGGGAGNDRLDGGDGADVLDGGAGKDTLYGDAGDDALGGGLGADTLDGGEGNDALDGGAGNDKLFGDTGDDTLSGGAGKDVLEGGAGNDFLDGGAGDDTLRGNEGDDVFIGAAGKDKLYGGEGNDALDGGAGNDKLFGDAGDDSLTGGAGKDVLEGGSGSDLIDGGGGDDTLSGDDGDDVLLGGAGKDKLDGGDDDDLLVGDAGNDTLKGGDGDDVLRGGAGDDNLVGGTGLDTADYSDATSSVTVDLTTSAAQDTGGAGVDKLSGIETVVGSDHDDTFVFSKPSKGAEYAVDGGGGSNTIDLSQFNSGDAIVDRDAGSINVSMGGNKSFTIKYDNVDRIQFADGPTWLSDAGPAAEPGSVSMMEDGVAAIDLGDSADRYRIDSLPAHGTLTLNGESVAEGDVITQAQIDAGELTFTPDADWNGSTAFEFSAYDGQAWSDQPANFDIRVNPVDDAPLAEAGADQTVNEGDLVQLSATVSDVEGQPLSYEWVQVSGPQVTLDDPTSANPTFAAPDDVTNTAVVFELHASDGTNTSVDSVTVTINADDDAPSADAGEDFTAEEGDTVTLTGTGSDTEDQELTYQWVQVSGPQVTLDDPTSDSPTFTAPEGVSNTDVSFELRVSDGTNTSVDTVTVTINADDDAPSADAGPDLSVDEGDTVVLTGSGSDVEGQDLSYEWVQVSGPQVTLDDPHSATPSFSAPAVDADAEIRFELRVSDGTKTSVDTVSVTVVAAPEAPPTEGPFQEPAGPDASTPDDDAAPVDAAPDNQAPNDSSLDDGVADDASPISETPVDAGPVLVGPGGGSSGVGPSGPTNESAGGGVDGPELVTAAATGDEKTDWDQVDGEQLRAQLRILDEPPDDVTFQDHDADPGPLLREFEPAGEVRLDPVTPTVDWSRLAFGSDAPGHTAEDAYDVVGRIARGDDGELVDGADRLADDTPALAGRRFVATAAALNEDTGSRAESESHAVPEATAAVGSPSADGFFAKLWSALRGTAGAIGPRDRKD